MVMDYTVRWRRFLLTRVCKTRFRGWTQPDWSDEGPGNLRVSYILPSAIWTVTDAGVYWPASDDSLLGDDGLAAGPHRLVWVDVSR